MPLFEYSALTERGKKFRATIDADSLQEAKLKLIRKQIAVLQIHAIGAQQMKDVLKKKDVLNLTRELARLLHAGLPLYESLCALEEKYQNQKAHRILLNLADMVRSGYTFSQALAKHPHVFDLLYVSMIENAEKTARLSSALDELTELGLKQLNIRKQLVSTFLYPAILTSFCLVVLFALFFYVIPSLKDLFEGRDLHPFTKFVFSISEFFIWAKGGLSCLFLGVFFLGLIPFWSKKFKAKLFALQFQVPFLKKLLAKIALIRFFRAVATLLEGGLPIIQVFEKARAVVKHPKLESLIARAQERIASGEAIHVPFQNHPLIPALVPRMIAIAEEGGKLSFMMKQIAQIYEEELEKTLTQFTAAAQPILLLVLGAIIGFVLLSVLLPMTDVSSFTM